ncbi:MAG: YggT family protein [Chromatiaceae bacterium]|nr:YggT family protein [Chromatiaceae bacterium]
MTDGYLLNPLVFLIQTIFGLYTAVVAIRFLLQWTRADFYNPISQFVVKVTSPPLRPLRKFIPGYGGYDIASLVLAWLLKTLELMLLTLLLGMDRPLYAAFGWAIPGVIKLFLDIFLFAILIRAILSWVSPDPYNPAVSLLARLTDPLMRPAQRLIRPISGIDLSPMAVIIALVLIEMLLVPPLNWLVGSPF